MSNHIHVCQNPDPILRTTCTEIPVTEIVNPPTGQIIAEMRQALMESGDGVAIAAPQIGHAVRIFIVAGSVLDALNNYRGEHVSPDKIFINPEIIKHGKEIKPMRGEGCLSVRFVYGTTKRYNQVTVRAYDEHGKEFTLTGKGLLAQIFQHEIDHLNGILFIDHAHDIRKMEPAEQASYEQELERMKKERMAQ
jgi:peptide deformylase